MAPEEYIHFIKVHEFVVRTMGSNLHRIALGLTCAWTLALRPVLARAPLSMPQVKARYYTHKEENVYSTGKSKSCRVIDSEKLLYAVASYICTYMHVAAQVTPGQRTIKDRAGKSERKCT